MSFITDLNLPLLNDADPKQKRLTIVIGTLVGLLLIFFLINMFTGGNKLKDKFEPVYSKQQDILFLLDTADDHAKNSNDNEIIVIGTIYGTDSLLELQNYNTEEKVGAKLSEEPGIDLQALDGEFEESLKRNQFHETLVEFTKSEVEEYITMLKDLKSSAKDETLAALLDGIIARHTSFLETL